MEPMRTIIYGADSLPKLEAPVALVIPPVREAVGADLTAACEQSGLRCVAWADMSAPPPMGGRTPALLVAELPPGERRIPDQVVSLMGHTFADAPLLLLCTDPLHRPAVSLQNGRVTLVGPPLTSARLSSRLRVLLAGRIPTRRQAITSRDSLNARWWVSSFASHNGDRALFRQQPTEGITSVLPAAGVELSEDLLAQAVAILRKVGSSPEEQAEAVEQLLGEKAGLVHLSPTADSWFLYWPDLPGPLHLFSSQRLPNFWDVGAALRRTGVRWTRIPAVGGDLLSAVTAALPSASESGGAGFASAMADGGPALLDLVESHLTRAPEPLAGLVAEVR